MFSVLAFLPMLASAPLVAPQPMRTEARVDTTVAPDTGLVLLTDTAVHTMMRLDTALIAVANDHPELRSVYQGLSSVNPYAIAKAPLLMAVLERVGWTPMRFSQVRTAYMVALEGIMPVALTGTRPGMTTIADRNVNFLIDHQVEYGIEVTGMNGAQLPPPSTPSSKPTTSVDVPASIACSEQPSTVRSAGDTAKDAGAFQEVTLTPDQGSLRSLLTETAQRAHREHMTPIVDVGAPWCAACHTIDSLMHQDAMRDTMQGILLVHLNLDYWQAELDSLGINAASIPVMFAVDQRGAPLDVRMQGVTRDELTQFISVARPRFAASKTNPR